MSTNELPPPVTLLRMMTGYWISQSIYVAAKLGVADLLRDGSRTSDELARACDAHANSFYRLMRGLASIGVFTEVAPQRFASTPLAELLRTDHPKSMRALAIMYAEEQYRAWGDALMSVQTGMPAFDRLFGVSYFQYLAEHPEAGATFNAAMLGWSVEVANALVDAYDFTQSQIVVDVGGGHGRLLAGILRANPHVQGLLFDLPHVVETAEPFLQAAGVADRCRVLAGDFFASLPGGDTYILAQILHDWDDNQSRTILQNCRDAMAPGGRLVIVEMVLPPGNEPSFGKLLDLHMLVLLTGRERTEAEFNHLLASTGFHLTRVIPTQSGASIVEAVQA